MKNGYMPAGNSENRQEEAAVFRLSHEISALRASEKLYRTLVDAAQDFVYVVDQDFRIVYVNEASARILRSRPEHLIGKYLGDVFPPETFEHQAASLQKVFATGLPLFTETPNRFPDGIRWLNARLTPLLDDSGEVAAVAGTSLDITQRVEHEAELQRVRSDLERRVEERTRALTETNQLLGQEITERRKAENLSRIQRDLALCLGLTHDLKAAMDEILSHLLEVPGVDCGMIYLVDEETGALTAISHRGLSTYFVEISSHYAPDSIQARLVNAGRPRYGLHQQVVPGEPERHREGLRALAVIPVLSEGRVVACLNLASHTVDALPRDTRDLLEASSSLIGPLVARVKAEAALRASQWQLQQSQKLESLGVLAGGIAHDFNNLLMGVLGNADLVILDLDRDSAVRGRVEDIRTAAIRLAELTNQMLAYAGKGTFREEPVDLSALVEEILRLVSASISKKVILHAELAPDLPVIPADPSQLRQVVVNLVTNAAEAIDDGEGSVWIRSGTIDVDPRTLPNTLVDRDVPPGQFVFLEVADTGAGLDDAIRTKIFDPFFTTKVTGRGLGLASVLGLVRSHRGAIQVESEPGRGSTFRTFFPCPEVTLVKEVQPIPSVDTWQGRGTVLVVDDEQVVRTVATAILENVGFKVVTAIDGLAAIETVQSQTPLVAVLLDASMPRMDGAETLARIRLSRPDLPVIMTSGYCESFVMNRDDATQPLAFLQKPFRAQTLIEKVQELLKAAKAPACLD
ncbi:MAG: PAS domain-containing protein [Thermoanaerobaculaceae bacterium]|jgi:PAS domain S-box-containing protein|nr:PAS domain-containing protein [Thermoanaerobaculaceae bacterium]